MKRVMAVAMMLSLVAIGADAQRAGRIQGQVGQGGPPPEGRGRGREELEGEVRRVFAQVVRNRVGLTDEQMQKLGPMSERHAIGRRRLQAEERATRAQLEVELLKQAPSDTAVGRLLDRFTDIQRQRTTLMESEQKDLATIMSPVQRARFNALQEQLRRQVEQRRGGGPPGGGPGPGGDMPPRQRPRDRRPPL